jgi:hypothetical protein
VARVVSAFGTAQKGDVSGREALGARDAKSRTSSARRLVRAKSRSSVQAFPESRKALLKKRLGG